MLPEAVRALAGHLQAGRKTYVHCTAGINRATLTVVGFLTLMEGMELDKAVTFVRERRPQAHPYVDCFKVGPHSTGIFPSQSVRSKRYERWGTLLHKHGWLTPRHGRRRGAARHVH